jgi:hypothetical protein
MLTGAAHLFAQLDDDTIIIDLPGDATTAAMTAKQRGTVTCVRTGPTSMPPAPGATTCRIENIVLTASAPPAVACGASSAGAAGEVCAGPEGCGAPWTCQPALDCTAERVEFCGCDGVTFEAPSACPGAPIAHAGPCG